MYLNRFKCFLFSTIVLSIIILERGTHTYGMSLPVNTEEPLLESSLQPHLIAGWFKSPWKWPSTPRPPKGRRKPGGSLSGARQDCSNTESNLIVLAPPGAQGITQSEQPTFWFYIPYDASAIRIGRFSIMSWDSTQRFYKTSFTLPETPGWVSLQVPRTAAAMLQTDEAYHWYFNLYCQENSATRPDVTVHGWVQPMSSGTLEPDWYSYDDSDQLARELQTAQPTDQVKSQWADWLSRLELDDLIDAPVVGPVLEPDSEPITNENIVGP